MNFDFSVFNPLQNTDLISLINAIADKLILIAAPIAVGVIIWSGIMFLISRGDMAKVEQAKKMLWYAIVGLAIILIGKGFITLLESILGV